MATDNLQKAPEAGVFGCAVNAEQISVAAGTDSTGSGAVIRCVRESMGKEIGVSKHFPPDTNADDAVIAGGTDRMTQRRTNPTFIDWPSRLELRL